MRKKIGILACVFLLVGCSSTLSKETKTLSNDELSDELWSYSEINDSATYASELIGSENYQISFWLKPTSNFPNTSLMFLGDEEEYISLIGSDYTDGILTGICLSSKHGDQIDWIVAPIEKTVATNRYNYIHLDINKDLSRIYVNGELVAEGNINSSLKTKELSLNSNDIGLRNVEGWYSELTISNDAVDEESIKNSYLAKQPNVLLDTISFKDEKDLQRSLWFEDYTIEGIPVTWQVVNQDVMDNRGVIQDLSKESDIEVIASIEGANGKVSKTFNFHVTGSGEDIENKKAFIGLDNDLSRVMHSNETLPSIENDMSVTYEILSGEAHIEDNRIIKDSKSDKEVISIKASIGNNSKTYELVLLDEVYGYAMAYFNGELGQEVGHIALSEDGLHWKDTSITINPTIGTKSFRDPFVTRDKNGNFLITATQGFNTNEVYIYESKDLLSFENEKLVLVNVYDHSLKNTGTKAWAPTIYYDMNSDEYFLLFSDPSEDKGTILKVKSKDLNEFSYPEIFFDVGYPVIDQSLVKNDGKYWMFYKDERKPSQTIFYASSDNLEYGMNQVYDQKFLLLEKGVEGPIVFKGKDDDYIIYVDKYGDHKFLVGKFYLFNAGINIDWLSENEFSLSNEDVRHGSVIGLTESEYKLLQEN